MWMYRYFQLVFRANYWASGLSMGGLYRRNGGRRFSSLHVNSVGAFCSDSVLAQSALTFCLR